MQTRTNANAENSPPSDAGITGVGPADSRLAGSATEGPDTCSGRQNCAHRWVEDVLFAVLGDDEREVAESVGDPAPGDTDPIWACLDCDAWSPAEQCGTCGLLIVPEEAEGPEYCECVEVHP